MSLNTFWRRQALVKIKSFVPVTHDVEVTHWWITRYHSPDGLVYDVNGWTACELVERLAPGSTMLYGTTASKEHVSCSKCMQATMQLHGSEFIVKVRK